MEKDRSIDFPIYKTSRVQTGAKREAGKAQVSCILLVASALWFGLRIGYPTRGITEAPILRTDKIGWTSCGDGYECGRLLVPLDYLGGTPGYADLSVGRLLAKNTTAKLGSLFVNPGGPGGSGMSFLFRAGPFLADLLDNRYDIVSWDPRGINGTSPGVNCYDSQTAQDIAFGHTNTDIGFEARNLSDPIDRAVYTQQARKADAENAVIVELCLNRTGEALRHVGTATVVLDLELLSRVIDGPEKPVNFWGFSYGTVIGEYFVNMFPHRVGNVAIDGVVNPEMWATVGVHEWTQSILVDTEKTYTNFLKACEDAGPARCALNTNETSTDADIREAVGNFINDLYLRPLPVPLGKQPYILTSGMVRNIILVHMYRPRTWATLAELLAAAMRRNGAPIADVLINTVEVDVTKKAKTAMANEAILCIDGPELGGLGGLDPLEAVEAIVQQNVLGYEKIANYFSSHEIAMCHHWKPREAERFTGPFNHTDLANDILIIGNTADPVTPLMNARAVNKMLPQSRLIIQDGNGHCSIALTSICTVKAIRGYFLDGVLPPNGLVCEVVEQYFPDNSAPTAAETWLRSEAFTSEADIRLAGTMRSLGQAMEQSVGLYRRPKQLP
ncbi:hypothetical protein BDV93DRAFT_604946 [Ceratobasidium sp. AG-I]|nr:hypothetical protein BDV93DRAFT_604946 [Ceratobasidium sp. AG-I]